MGMERENNVPKAQNNVGKGMGNVIQRRALADSAKYAGLAFSLKRCAAGLDVVRSCTQRKNSENSGENRIEDNLPSPHEIAVREKKPCGVYSRLNTVPGAEQNDTVPALSFTVTSPTSITPFSAPWTIKTTLRRA